MRQQLWRVFGTAILVGVVILLVATNTRQFADAYFKVDPSPDWSFAAALMIVGAMVLALMFPQYAASRWGFLGLATALVAAVAINVAGRLDLMEMDPVTWRWISLWFSALPFGLVALIVWSQVVNLVQPILGIVTPETDTDTIGETARNLVSGVTPERKLTGVSRKSLQRPPEGFGVKLTLTPGETKGDTDTETPPDTATDTRILKRTLAKLQQQGGDVSAAARELGLSRTGVNKQIKRLYAIDPDAVKKAVPNWVARNIKDIEVQV